MLPLHSHEIPTPTPAPPPRHGEHRDPLPRPRRVSPSALQGDQVDELQPLCEVQSDKATIEITRSRRRKETTSGRIRRSIVAQVVKNILLINASSYMAQLLWFYAANMSGDETDNWVQGIKCLIRELNQGLPLL